MPKTCAFCGAPPPLTVEHLWPSWLRKLLHGDPKTRAPVTQHVFLERPAGRPQTRQQPSLLWCARIVCSRCNGGWMADLDRAVRPFVERIVVGKRTTLSRTDQKQMARWVAKTAMVFTYTTPRRPIPANQRHYLRLQLRPPPSSQAWIGIRSAEEGIAVGGVLSFGLGNRPEPESKTNRAYLVTLGIGYLVIAFFGHDLGFEVPWARPLLEPIWPVSESPIKWPPKYVFGSIDDLANDAELEGHVRDSLASRGVALMRVDAPSMAPPAY